MRDAGAMRLARRPVPPAGLVGTASFLIPGLGHLLLGMTLRGTLLLVPLGVTAVIVLAGLALGPARLAGTLLRPEVLISALIVNLLLFAHRVYAIVDAHRWSLRLRRPVRTPGTRHADHSVIAVLLVGSVILHGAVGVVGVRTYQALDAVFSPGGAGDDWAIPRSDFEASPVPPSPTAPSPATPSRTPPPVPEWITEGRVNLLLLGSDAGPGRTGVRTDTMLVLSVDVESGRAALFGIPRNLVGVPLPPESADAVPGGTFPGLLTELHVYAMERPEQFPGGEARGFRAVGGAVQELVGVPLHGMVGVDLQGFVRLVDSLGGLWIDVPAGVVDARYPAEDGSGAIPIRIEEGCQWFDGKTALAYARSRRQDWDYARMERQQDVLVALRRQLDPLAVVPRVPTLLDIAEDSFWTTVPRDEIEPLAELADRVEADDIERVTFAPPRYPASIDDDATERIRAVVRTVFDEDEDEPEASAPRPAVAASPGVEATASPEPEDSCPPTSRP